jgi:hypothetical protein
MPGIDTGQVQIDVPVERIEEFCRTWHVAEFALFGSVLNDEFRADSDVDVMVTYEPGHVPRFHDLLEMEDELHALYGRPIHLVEKSSIVNPYRRHHIMHHHRVLYAA